MTNIVVTGAAGFIGSHLCERLLNEGHSVLGIDSFDSFLYDAAIKRRNAALLMDRPRFELAEVDICSSSSLASLFAGQELVVHLAALAGVRPSIAEPLRYARTNVEGTMSVFEACRSAHINRLVFASSSSVYGARFPRDAMVKPFSESDPCLTPASPYAATKRAGELIASTYRDLFGIGITSLRFFTVYGPRQRPEMAIHKFTRAIASMQPITLFGDGMSARDYTFIDDIIDGVYAACLKAAPGAYAIYNLGGSRTTTLKHLVELIGAALHMEPESVWAPDQPGDVPITYADVSLAHSELGYSPKVPIEEGIKRFVAWYRQT